MNANSLARTLSEAAPSAHAPLTGRPVASVCETAPKGSIVLSVMNSAVERAHSEWMRSRELFSRSESLAQRIIENLRLFNGRPFGDSDGTFRLRLPRFRPAVALLRHDLRRWLEAHGVAHDELEEIVVACSEACANAVEHPIDAAEQAFVVEAAVQVSEVEIVVRDSGHWQVGPGVETRGRGMDMIRALMSDVGVVEDDHGTAIVMRRRLR